LHKYFQVKRKERKLEGKGNQSFVLWEAKQVQDNQRITQNTVQYLKNIGLATERFDWLVSGIGPLN